MSDNSSAASGGISFAGLLTIAFVVLKLTGYINWSWWWVTVPMWGFFGVIIAVVIVWVSVQVFISIGRKLRTPPGKEKQKSKWQDRIEEMKKKREADGK